ncbi:unnamed protein product [marine sediment metagenome]|uniref:Uncharacterized protein n=1 Tax=marine sediment metagenome TaxID=412755 RepID=X0UGC7_9ZZZZ
MLADGVSADPRLVNDRYSLPVNWRDIEAYAGSSAYTKQIAALFLIAYVMHSYR